MVKVSAHVRRIEAVEKELKAISESSATKEDISRVRAEMKKLYDGLHVGKWTQDVLGIVTSSEQLRRILGLARACMGYP